VAFLFLLELFSTMVLLEKLLDGLPPVMPKILLESEMDVDVEI